MATQRRDGMWSWLEGSASVRVWLAAGSMAGLLACSDDTKTTPKVTPGEDAEEAPDATIDGDAGAQPDVPAPDSGAPDTSADVPPSGCQSDADCNKAPDPCYANTGTCTGGVCEYNTPAPAGTVCDSDNLACTADSCDGNGLCVAGKPGSGCGDAVKAFCDEAKKNGGSCDATCKQGICAEDGSGKCEVKNAANKTPCDDGNACTTGDECAAGTCAATGKKDCSGGGECVSDACDPKTGCSNAPQVGKPCNDNNNCTVGDVCDAKGLCSGPTPVVCDDQNPCTQDVCDPTKGCKFQPASAGAPCATADACFEAQGTCKAGKCDAKPLATIDDGNDCTTDKCKVGTTGKAEITHVAATGQTCEDGNPCTKGDLCDSGAACKGTNLVCNDGNPCTADTCDPKICTTDGSGKQVCGQCAYVNLADGATCTDGDLCTTLDSCQKGACTGKDWQVTKQCDDNNDCTKDGCTKGGGCFNAAQDGAACNDGNACTIADKCAGSKCAGPAKDCKDGNPCTQDTCNPKDGTCVQTQFVGPCSDGDACTTGDTCTGGVCSGTKITCNDGNPCTTDFCDTVAGCQHKPVSGGTPCDDGLSCTTGDTCSAGKCIAAKDTCVACNLDGECKAYDDTNFCNGVVKCIASPANSTPLVAGKAKVCAVDPKTVVKCDASKDTECAKNSCNPDTGVCSVIQKAEGLPCSGGNKCIDNATCTKDGQCVGIEVKCDDKNPCTTDTCTPLGGCQYSALPNGSDCDDNNACTTTSACQTGKCVGGANSCTCKNDQGCVQFDDGNACNGIFKCVPNLASPQGGFCEYAANSVISCPALDGKPCQDNVCDPAKGTCAPKNKLDGAACNDNDACTTGEACAAGLCSSSKKVNCDDGQPCTIDACDFVFGCLNAPAAKGALCNDGTACTQNDTCDDKGNCAGTKLNCDDGNACTIDLCDKTKGCTIVVQDGSVCDDGNPCTKPDSCKDATCNGVAVNCDDGNPCTVDACDSQGNCKNVLVEGKDCSDGDGCTIGDACTGGKCVGKAKNCDDANPCTTDACSKGACVITAKIGQTCDDNNSCTTGDTCDAKAQCVGKLNDCKTGTVCLINLNCSPVTGCVNVPNDGVLCTDNDQCTFNDKCSGGGCQGTKLNCDDQNLCTNDSCDAKIGCLFKQNTCDDNNPCTVDICDKVKGCINEKVNGAKCDDGNKCHEQGQCNSGSCVVKDVVCNDKNGCTNDSCDPASGCVFAPGDPTVVTCDDANPCTTDACDAGGKCVGTAVVCDDGNPCTTDSCDPLKGCVVTDVKDNTGCDDDNACTKDTVCQGGKCSGGSVLCAPCNMANGDKDCAPFDNNNKCDGTFKCEMDAGLGKSVCVPKPTPVVCDTSNDTFCAKNQCDPLSGTCGLVQALNGTKCEDGKGCTVGDQCQNGKCAAGQPNTCDGAKDACNDATCVEDPLSQAGFACVAKPKEGVPCDADGSGCTFNDTCSAGKCLKGAAVDCKGVAKTCEVASCKSTGANTFQCAVSLAVDGTPCEDGQLCTVGDNCKAGKCTAGTKPYDCSGISTICAVGFCDKTGNGGTGACVPQAQNEGKNCNADDNGCTTNDKCLGGLCVPGAAPDCSLLNAACASGACKSTDAGTFQCVPAAKGDKLPCEADNNGCTVGDACLSGKCAAGPLKDCSAQTSKDGCLVGTCKSLSAASNTCIAQPAPIGQLCDADGNGCTKGDACNKDGACQPGAAVDCLSNTNSCSQGVCQSTGAATFVCNGNPKPDGTSCDADKDGCTQNDACKAGKCVVGAAVKCPLAANADVCMLPKCVNAGSDKFQCDTFPLKDGTACNKDSNGCTKDDACQLGFCTAGDLETCSAQASLCGDAACQSTGDNAFKCNVTPKASFAPLDPPVPCTTTDAPPKCPSGYECTLTNVGDKTGLCSPTKTVFCDDKDLCTLGDVCDAGVCKAGAQLDCDDDDPCTLDACKAGVCSHTQIAGCAACVKEGFEAPPKGWIDLNDDVTFVTWAVAGKQPYADSGALRTTWTGPNKSYQPPPNTAPIEPPTVVMAKKRYRRMYVEASVAPQIDFYLAMTVSNQNCGIDDFQVLINDVVVWEKCDNVADKDMEPGSKYMHVVIDLAKYAGSSIDIALVTVAGTLAENNGTIDVDSFRLVGACGPGCLGMTFEPIKDGKNMEDVVDEFAGALPQPVALVSSNSTYLDWKLSKAAAHTLTTGLIAKYTGAPPNNVLQTAKVVVPGLKPIAGDKLWFALRASGVGDPTCNGDDFSVTIDNGTTKKVAYTRCDNTTGWKTESIDLAAYASQTVDVTFTVTSGTAGTSAGVFELDDVAIAGGCTYVCFRETFEDANSVASNWQTVSGDTKALTGWKVATPQAVPPVSPTKAGFASYDATKLVPKKDSLTSFHSLNGPQVGPLGAQYYFNFNVFQNVDTCNVGQGTFALRGLINNAPATLAPQLQKVNGEEKDANWTMMTTCKSSSGWGDGPLTGEVPMALMGRSFRLSLVLIAQAAVKTSTVFVDDVTILCR